ncbi:hypothetical protein L4C36_22710 [Photobacterium japonica]|uniref:hypothetical protein n=1 Tax=Photobacterium japonica TaxID=2910235 RepID=UPI003D10B012
MAQAKAKPAAPSAAESLANIHALFNAQSRGGMMYDHLPQEVRATLCFGARLSRNHVSMKLADMNDVDRAKLHRTINKLGESLKNLQSCPLSEFH